MSTNVEIRLKLNDKASAGLKSAAKVAEDIAKKTAQVNQNTSSRSVDTYSKTSQARTALGIKSENTIQREIQRTEAAYNRLAKSGVMSANSLARAQDASNKKIKDLRRELNGAEKDFGRMNKLALGGAAVAAYAMAKPAVDKAVSYDRTVASMTNTMFSERDVAGRIAGKAEIKNALDAALAKGGGTREAAAGTLNSLIGSGQFTKAQAYSLTGTVQKAATATGADSGDIAKIALSAKQMGIKPEDIEAAISKAIVSGQKGGFELVDMAKSLPEVLASAKALGLTGMDGFERVLASMQSSVLTAGTKDSAANNLVNILEKINSNDTAIDFQKQGIDLRAELGKGALRGEDTITTFTKLIDRAIANDPKSKAVNQELDRLKTIAQDKANPQREQALKQMEAIYNSGVTGKFLQDRQALMGFRAESQGEKDGSQAKVREALRKDNGQELNASYAVMSDTASAELQRLENSKLKGQDELLTGVGSKMKPLFSAMVDLSTQYPVLTASVIAAKDALLLLAGAAVLNSVGGGKLPKIPKAAAIGSKVTSVVKYAAAAGSALLTPAAAGVAGAGLLGYGVGSGINYGLDKGISAATGQETSLGSWLYDVMNQPAAKPAEPIAVKNDIKVGLSDGLRLVSQTSNSKGPVTNLMQTGSVWGIP